jgi:hypothetical protein
MSCQSPPPWHDYSNDIWRRVQFTKTLLMQLSPFSCYFIPLLFSSAPCSQMPSVYVLQLVSGAISMPIQNYRQNMLLQNSKYLYCHVWMTIDGVWMVTRFIDHLYTHDSWLNFIDHWHTDQCHQSITVCNSHFLATNFIEHRNYISLT